MQGMMIIESISVYLSLIHHHLLLLLLVLLALLFLLPQCQLNAQNSEVDALLRIKDAVGASSSNLQSWNTSMPDPCSWNGVNCSTTGHVTALNMSAFNLQGQLPKDSFTSLTELTSLDLSNNLLKSPVPSLSALTLLHDLNLSTNLFVEAFPGDILSLTELVELRLSNNKFQGSVPEDISKLQKLEQLWLGNNSFTSLPESLSSLLHLTVLTAWGNVDLKLTLPPEWGVWVNITYLNLHDIRLTGTLPSEWGANFTKLERLSLYQNHLEGSIPESWKSMTNLNELRMYTNKLSGIVPSWIGDIKNKSARVQFSCNYLQGPYPTFFADESLDTWKGNCFDSDFGSHRQVCGDGSSCQEFFENSLQKKRLFLLAASLAL